MTTPELTTRNASLADLASLLRVQDDAKLDAVVPARAIRSEGGVLRVGGMGPDGPAGAPALVRPTEIMDGHLADKLGVPVKYLRRMRAERIDLYDANVNGWLRGERADGSPFAHEADPRKFLVRSFTSADLGGEGVGRALLSDSYKVVDNLDAVLSALSGVRESGVEAEVISADLSERRMVVRVASPDVAVLAPELLAGYRPTSGGWDAPRALAAAAREGQGYPAGEEPVTFAGFRITNGETGGSRYQISSELLVRVCRNGLVLNVGAFAATHLGGRKEEGIVRFSGDTQRKELALIQAQTRDAVATFLDREYVAEAVAALSAEAGTPLPHAADVVTLVGKELSWSEEDAAGILDHFIRGGQATSGGVMQAVTAYSQTVADPAVADELETRAVKAMELASAAA